MIKRMKLYNSFGEELADLTDAVNYLYGNKEMELNLSSLRSGVYFIVARNNQYTYSKSFVVLK